MISPHLLKQILGAYNCVQYSGLAQCGQSHNEDLSGHFANHSLKQRIHNSIWRMSFFLHEAI